MEKKKMGRPLKEKEELNTNILIRISKIEKEKAEKKASLKNMKLAEYIRYLIRKDK